MLLAIDIGNTRTKFGLFEGDALVRRMNIPTNRRQSTAEIFDAAGYKKARRVVIASVVPELRDACRRYAELLKAEVVFVDNAFDFGLKIKYEPPESVGVDRLVAAFAAVEKYGKPCIVCDFGTATTIDAVNSQGEYLGGIIVAGMNLLADALFQKTSKLPRIEIAKPEKVIGNSTVKAIQSGTYFGYIGLVDGIIGRMIGELGETPRVIATGGDAQIIAESSSKIEAVEADLMLEGLRLIDEKRRR